MDAPPRISVISIFFNAERYFSEAIDSVLCQDMDDFELLLVDDGSKDGSTAIALDYVSRFPDRVRYLEHPEHANRGMSATRNLGLSHARGAFVAFIDADDRWRPGKLREQLSILEADPALGAVCGAVNYWHSWNGGKDRVIPTGHRQNEPVGPPEATLNLYPLGTAPAPCPSDLMLRSSQVAAIGGFEGHFTGARQMYEDQGFLGKLYLVAPIYFSNAIWLDYRQHDDSCVASVKRDGLYGDVRLYYLEWFANYLRNTGGNPDPRIDSAVRRAIFACRHPIVSRFSRKLKRMAARVFPGTARA